MVSQFKGLIIKVITSDGSSIMGLVTNVINGELILSDGKYHSS